MPQKGIVIMANAHVSMC